MDEEFIQSYLNDFAELTSPISKIITDLIHVKDALVKASKCKAYNFVENIHQLWLLVVVDLIIGKTEYSA